MTTLRRELIQIIKKDLNEYIATGMNHLGEEVPDEIVGKLADDILKISGIANSPAARKFSDPFWDLLHGGEVDENAVDMAAIYTSIAERLEKGLKRGEFPQTADAQKVYKWIYEKEQAGEGLDAWIKWAMDDGRDRFSFVYHKDPTLIKRDWMQVYNGVLKPVKRSKFERLND